ncbi:MAG: pyridoxamine 5'-phosphate oxidase [Phaeodactylibacter sp.]|nr:pyridoxamine 5'-phosphate oxidase [Phaeodactylibacter sp.]
MAILSNQELQNLREDYRMAELDEAAVSKDPIQQFSHWLSEALEAQLPEPNAMVLSTVDARQRPSARVVLLKGVEGQSFVFFTNYESRKGREIDQNPYGALTFNWLELQRQVRITGKVERIDEAASTAYFQSRPKGSQIGAWASDQSQVLKSRDTLEKKYTELEKKYATADLLPKPRYWGGYRLLPDQIEFWQGRSSRLHDRLQFDLIDGHWQLSRLYP